MRAMITAGVLALIAPAVQAGQPLRQFGNVIYAEPPGWTAGRQEGGTLVYLSDLPDDACAFCTLHFSTSLTDGTDPVAALRWRGLRFVDEEDRAEAEPLGEPGTFAVGGRPGAMQGYRIGGDLMIVLAVGLSDRVEMVGLSGGGGEEDLPGTLRVLEETVTPLFEGLSFVSEGAAPLMPAPVPGELDGVWWGWNTYTTFGLDMMMRQDMAFRTLILWPDGRFFDGTPPGGLQGGEPAGLMDQGRTDFGVYVRQGDTLTLTFANGATETLTADGEGWNDGARTLRPVDPLPDGTALDGAISSVFYTGFTPNSGVTGGISSSSATVFRPDGTYTGSSFGGAFGSFDAGGGYAVSSGDDTGGTYAVRDGLLVTTPRDGPPRAVLALRQDGTIILGDQFLDTD